MDQHVTLMHLDEPPDRYVWAATGDIAFAKCSQRLGEAAREPIRRGWSAFKYALERKIERIPLSDESALEMITPTITLVVERFQHKRYGRSLALRFATIKDQQLYLWAYPHLALAEPDREQP